MSQETNEQLSKQIIDDFLSNDIPNMTPWQVYVAGFTKGGDVALDL